MNEFVEVVKKKHQRENAGVKASIEKWIETNLQKETYVIYKNWGGGIYGKGGRPDLEITYQGQVNYWELKDENGFLSTLQKEVIRRYAYAGKTIYVASSLSEFLEIWKKIYK